MVCTCGHQWRAPAFSSKRLEGTIKFQWFSHRDYYFSRSAMTCLHHLFTFSVYSDSFYWTDIHFVCHAVQFSSVTQSCPTLCDPMNRSMPGLPVHHQLLEFTQTHVHRVNDTIQPSHPLSSPSPPAPNPSQHQSLFQWVNSSHEVAKVLEFQL